MAETGTTKFRPWRLWRIALWGLLGLVLAWVALTWITSQVMRPGVGLPAHFGSPMRLSGTPVHVRLAGEDYCIPVNYLDAPLDPGVDQTHLLLQALLPDLEPRNPETFEEIWRTRGFGRKIRLLVTAVGDPTENLLSRYRTRINRYGPFVRVGRYFDLEVETTGDGARFGRRESYVHAEGLAEEGFLWCDLPGDVPSPSCRHMFIVNGRVTVQATYGRGFLFDWQRISESIERRFQDFRKNTDCHRPPPPENL